MSLLPLLIRKKAQTPAREFFAKSQQILPESIIAGFFLLTLAFPCFAGTRQNICFKNTCVSIEISDSEISRAKGLMFRENLPKNSGMFFIFPEEGVYSFWMKNTLIPLDIIWLDKDLRVVYIESFVPPCKRYDCPSYGPQVKAKYVLEVNAGFCGSHQVKINDKANLKND
jgi:uncharacterized protein